MAAYQGDPNVKGPNYLEERHQAMTESFKNKDYNAWKDLMVGKGRVTQVVNKDNFSKFADAHILAEKGKVVEAQKIFQELGLGAKNCSGQGMNKVRGLHKGQGMHKGQRNYE